MRRRAVLNGWAGLLACLWYGMIWRFSAQPATQSGQMSDGLLHNLLLVISPSYGMVAREVQIAAMEILSFYERKAAHMFLYFVLALLIWLAVFGWKNRPGLWYGVSIALCAILAALDEYHQTLVPGRSGEVRDVLVDLGGVVIGLAGLLWMIRVVYIRRSRRIQLGSFWLMPVGIGVLLFFVLWRDLGLLAPFSFRMMNGGMEQFCHLSEGEKLAVLRAASPVLREAMSLAGCTLTGCCAAGAVLSAGLRQGIVPLLLAMTAFCAVIFRVAGMSPLLALGFGWLGAGLILLAWRGCEVLFRWGDHLEIRMI